jgi:hypothetical protein
LEDERIEFLVQRDGRDAATAWVERTLGIYRQALSDRRSYALLPQYRPLFEDSIRTFESWLRNSVPYDNRDAHLGECPEVCVTAGLLPAADPLRGALAQGIGGHGAKHT